VRSKVVFAQLVCLGWGALMGAQSMSDQIPQANPGRPTVSTPATLTPTGYLQLETGALGASESPEFDTRFGLNEVMKLAVQRRIELILQTEPFVGSTAGAADSGRRPGEIFAGIQGVVLTGKGKRPTVSVSYFRRFHASPAPEIDIGTFRQNGTILVSSDLLGFHFDANGIVSEQTEESVRRAQFGQTLSVSHGIRKFTISGEIWHFSQPMLKSNAAGNLWAIGYTMRNNLVIDGGFDRGLTHTSTRWEGFFGFTYLLPHRLWKR